MRVAGGATGLAPGSDGTNAVIYVPGGFAPAGKALAVTILSYDVSSGAVVDADIVMNGRFKLAAITGSDGGGEHDDDRDDEHDAKTTKTYDIGRIAAHEMGHALGLGDEPGRTDAIMYPFVAPEKALRASPATDDLDGIATIYTAIESEAPPSDAHAGCALARVAGGAPRWSAIALGALGALVLVRARRPKRVVVVAGFAAALVAPPALSATPGSEDVAEVVSSRTISERGVFRTDLELRRTASAIRVSMWGGTLGGIRQEVGGRRVPEAGERVVLEASGLRVVRR
jgi:hypothetical protein